MPPKPRPSRSRKAAPSVDENADAPPVAPPATAAVPAANDVAAANDEDTASEEHEQVILQMPLNVERIHDLLHQDDIQTLLEYNPTITVPAPYEPRNTFASDPYLMNDTADVLPSVLLRTTPTATPAPAPPTAQDPKTATPKKPRICFHCCHDIGHMCFGMPTRYDGHTETFTTYGNFCSLECAAAFNFGTHMGSDRAWEIHSWIQILGRRYGFTEPIRPAPSRYLLQMFEGPLTIEQFRKAHTSQSRTLVLNIPPMISMPSQLECINTSYWNEAANPPTAPSTATGATGTTGATGAAPPSATTATGASTTGAATSGGGAAPPPIAIAPMRRPSAAAFSGNKKTLDSKLNLTFTVEPATAISVA